MICSMQGLRFWARIFPGKKLQRRVAGRFTGGRVAFPVVMTVRRQRETKGVFRDAIAEVASMTPEYRRATMCNDSTKHGRVHHAY